MSRIISSLNVPRITSLLVLIGILVFMAVLFFRVVVDFLFPMFMAVLLVVIFEPLHRWLLQKCRGRNRLAAGLTTATILLLVLAPLLFVLFQASIEGLAVYHNLESPQTYLRSLAEKVVAAGGRMGLASQPEEVTSTMVANVQEWLAPLALGTTQFVGNLLLALIVMVVSLYFFLADGPAMLGQIQRLSPLDDRYQSQLVEQFGSVSRAVVLATLLSAVTQGLLAGVGYYFAGLPAVFLLIVLTMLLSMIPFIGAVSVWIPACLWVYFQEGRTTAAILLAIYGALIVSTVDNIIKPVILHGRSNLHPLLALLSVLGGVKALGPIGIFVGPMVVAFLQTLLEMLHTELQEMGRTPVAGPSMRTGQTTHDVI